MSAQQKAAASDRNNLRGAYEPPGGVLGRPAASMNVRTAIAAVQDPHDAKRRLLATVSTRDDLLGEERSHKRISAEAYSMGRVLQAVFERASGANLGGGAGERVDSGDPALRRERKLVASLTDARTVAAFMDWIGDKVGTLGARRLRSVLCDGQSFAQLAGHLAPERRIAGHAFRFRQDLEDLADEWGKGGRDRPQLTPVG